MSANGLPPGRCRDAELIRRLCALRDRDGLDDGGQRMLHAHLAACGACRDEAVADDPTLLFASLSATAAAVEAEADGSGRLPARWEEASGAVEAERLAGDVLAAIRVRRTEGTDGAGRAGRRVALRAAAILLAVGGIAGFVLLSRSDDRNRSGLAFLPTPAAAAEVPSRPLIEEVGTPGVRVYEFAGYSPTEPNLVFVANPNADL